MNMEKNEFKMENRTVVTGIDESLYCSMRRYIPPPNFAELRIQLIPLSTSPLEVTYRAVSLN